MMKKNYATVLARARRFKCRFWMQHRTSVGEAAWLWSLQSVWTFSGHSEGTSGFFCCRNIDQITWKWFIIIMYKHMFWIKVSTRYLIWFEHRSTSRHFIESCCMQLHSPRQQARSKHQEASRSFKPSRKCVGQDRSGYVQGDQHARFSSCPDTAFASCEAMARSWERAKCLLQSVGPPEDSSYNCSAPCCLQHYPPIRSLRVAPRRCFLH